MKTDIEHRRVSTRFATYAFLLCALFLSGERLHAADDDPAAPSAAVNRVSIGIADHFKIGHWTEVRVQDELKVDAEGAEVSVTTLDNDGVLTTSSSSLAGNAADRERRKSVYTKVGRAGAPIEVSLTDSAATRQFDVLQAPGRGDGGYVELPAVAELLLFMGPWAPELLESYTQRNPTTGRITRKSAVVENAGQLPERWYGYNGVDVVVMTIGDGEKLSATVEQLAADETKLQALSRWVELGGRLVIFCSGEHAAAVFGEGGAMASLLPGTLAGAVRLPETGRLEHYAGSEVPIGGRGARGAILVPELSDVEDEIELFEGRAGAVLPLVVRSPRGLGEVTFVGVELSRHPLDEWPARGAFLQAVLRPYLHDEVSSTAQTLVTSGYNDLSGALRQRMGRSFAGVRTTTFTMVTLLAAGYLLVLGPLDYFVVRRWLKRNMVAWLTFPLIVLLFGGMALALVDWRHAGGGGRRVNQLELVDIDLTTGLARGTLWSAVYSPVAERIDLRLEVKSPAVQDGATDVLLSFWGLPGAGIGGTQASGLEVPIAKVGYHYAEGLSELHGVPILTSGTKSLLGQWTATASPIIVADLIEEDGLPAGTIENRTGRPLRNVRLLYNDWGFWLGNIGADGRVTVGDEQTPRRVKTIVTQEALGRSRRGEQAAFFADRATIKELVNLMMFYEAAGGFAFAQLPNQFQSSSDLSRTMTLGRAVLVAEVETEGSRLVDATSGDAIGDAESAGVIYRFVLPVGDSE